MNVQRLRQALRVVESVDDRMFREPPPSMNLIVASQLRHVIEYYECFLNQVPSGHIDYDTRQRDKALESCRAAMVWKLHETICRLETLADLRDDCLLFVRLEGAGPLEWLDPYATSSVARELGTLASHATHHLALVAAILRAWSTPVDPELGVAVSTLQHRDSALVAAAGGNL